MLLWQNKLQDAVMIFLSIIVEATPFILVGVLISAFLSHFVAKEKLLKIIPENRLGAIGVMMLFGFLFPVCECGNIPVARKLLQKGVKPFAVITFLLSAPVLNPLVLFATWSAFRFMPEIFYLRIIFTFAIALLIGLLMSFHPEPKNLLSKNFVQYSHEHADASHVLPLKKKIQAFFKTSSVEFFEIFGVLIFGAFLASTVQFLIPRNILLSLGNGPVLSVLTMTVFSVITAVCSNVDAFIALSYVNTFTSGSLLAFMTFGPLIDLKSFFMIKTIFRSRAIVIIYSLALLLTLLFTLSFNLYEG
jgi:uncharacterized membrane protein YraQ (UPF0718 family)